VKAEQFSRDAQDFLRLLAKHEVRYLLIGGIAVIYHGYLRLTGDVDVFYDCSRENAQRLWHALLEFWGGSVPAVSEPIELEDPNVVIQFGRPPNRIDLIGGLPAVPFAEAWARRVCEEIEVQGVRVPVWVLALADLRRSKMQAGRKKDLDDLDHLPG
jgi:hypothetical protein